MLERYAMKVARTVLRGGSGSNVTPLPDHWTGGMRTNKLRFIYLEYQPYNEHCPRPAHQQVTQPLGASL